MKKTVLFLLALATISSSNNLKASSSQTPILDTAVAGLFVSNGTLNLYALYNCIALIGEYKDCKKARKKLEGITNEEKLAAISNLEQANENLMDRLSTLGYAILGSIGTYALLVTAVIYKDNQNLHNHSTTNTSVSVDIRESNIGDFVQL